MADLPGFRRKVLRADMRTGRGSTLGPETSRRARWWELLLECGHQEERDVLYRSLGDPQRRDDAWRRRRTAADVLPAPRRVICLACRSRVIREARRG